MILAPTSCAFDAVQDYQELVLTRQGLEASAAPGWASVSCMSDADPQSIDVATDRYTYFTLADPQWRVASENYSVVKREEGWVWAVAPIEYVGPVHGCRTKYPLFAVCVDSPFNNVNCGWDGRRTGSWTYMRLLSAQGNIGHVDRKPFWDEWVPNPYDTSQKVKLHHENLFEYDSVSYDEAVRLVAEKQEAYDELVVAYASTWFGLTVPLTLWACLWLIRKGPREAKLAAEQDRREKQHIMIQESALAYEPAPPPPCLFRHHLLLLRPLLRHPFRHLRFTLRAPLLLSTHRPLSGLPPSRMGTFPLSRAVMTAGHTSRDWGTALCSAGKSTPVTKPTRLCTTILGLFPPRHAGLLLTTHRVLSTGDLLLTTHRPFSPSRMGDLLSRAGEAGAVAATFRRL